MGLPSCIPLGLEVFSNITTLACARSGGIPFGNIFLKTLHKSIMACFSHTLSSASVTLISNAVFKLLKEIFPSRSVKLFMLMFTQPNWSPKTMELSKHIRSRICRRWLHQESLDGNSPFHKCDLYQSPMLMSNHYFSISKRCRLIKHKRHTVINLKQNAFLGWPTQRCIHLE